MLAVTMGNDGKVPNHGGVWHFNGGRTAKAGNFIRMFSGATSF